ncbi:MAG: hypothetical protein P9L88_08820, partial [Candidatus Tantalella remota]|nr:hypothetical protein [Candidatus Tantalella remota]
DIYKDKAELLRNEEKKLRQDIKAIQLKILEKRNEVNLVKATQDFLLKLRSNPNTQQMDYLIKTFMRIIFKGIYIQNQEIVKVDINQPWKMCYDEALKMDSRFRGNDKVGSGNDKVKEMDPRFRGDDNEGEICRKKRKKRSFAPLRMTEQEAKKSTEETEPKAKVPRRESVYFCVPSDVR